MFDLLRRLLIAFIMGLCVSLLFLGTKHTEAGMIKIKEQVPQTVNSKK